MSAAMDRGRGRGRAPAYSRRQAEYIKTHYHLLPVSDIARAIHRPVGGIHAYARSLGLKHGVPPGHISLKEHVSPSYYEHMLALARQDGVLYKGPSAPDPLCVPEDWLMAQTINDSPNLEGWYTYIDIALLLNRPKLQTSLDLRDPRSRLARAMKEVTRHKGKLGRTYYEPEGARLALSKIKRGA